MTDASEFFIYVVFMKSRALLSNDLSHSQLIPSEL